MTWGRPALPDLRARLVTLAPPVRLALPGLLAQPVPLGLLGHKERLVTLARLGQPVPPARKAPKELLARRVLRGLRVLKETPGTPEPRVLPDRPEPLAPPVQQARPVPWGQRDLQALKEMRDRLEQRDLQAPKEKQAM